MSGDETVDKYKKLLSNTLIFAIGTFSSKLLVFFLTRLYTAVLTESEYGAVDLIQQTGNLLLPLVTLGITNAVIRFGLDRGVKKAMYLRRGCCLSERDSCFCWYARRCWAWFPSCRAGFIFSAFLC